MTGGVPIRALIVATFVAAAAQAPLDVAGLVKRADELRRSDFQSGRQEAESLYKQALPLAGNNLTLRSRIALELGALAAGRGSLTESQQWFAQAVAGFEAAGDRAGSAASLNQMGSILLTLGRISDARELYARSRAIWLELNNPRGQAQTLANDALAWRAAGEPQRALEANRVAIDLYRRAADRAGEATAMHNNSEVLMDLGDFEAGLREATEALALHQVAGPIGGEVHTRIHLAEAWIGLGDLEKARAELNAAALRSKQIGIPVQEAYILRETGRIHLSMAQPREALSRFQAALALVPAAGFPRMEAEIQLQAGHAAYASAPRGVSGGSTRSIASGAWRRALGLGAEIGNTLIQAEALTGLARISRDAGSTNDALDLATRAMGLIEDSRAAIANGTQRASYFALRSTAYGIAADVLVRRGDVARAFEVSERAHARALLDALRPSAAGQRTVPAAAPRSAAAVRASLAADTAVLEYLVSDDRSWLFALTRDTVRAYPLPGGSRMKALVSDLRTAIAEPGVRRLGRFVPAALEAYQTLIAPAIGAIREKSRLVIVPDGVLHSVPFEVFIDRPAGSFATLPYLIRNRTVSYAPSMSVAAAIAESDAAAPPAHTHDVAVFARSVAAAGLPALTFAEDEARAIAAAFPQGRTELRVDDAATVQALRSPAVQRARRLHFATHGVVRPPPGSSGLVLGSSSVGDDGFLAADDVSAFELSAELVVLSACDTGLGRQLAGEGTLGLTRAFMLAGASRVVSSLWRVDDRSTSRLMSEFYRGLRQEPAAALRAAKLELIADPATAHPYFWAGFVLSGR